jgi:hypothetical protein
MPLYLFLKHRRKIKVNIWHGVKIPIPDLLFVQEKELLPRTGLSLLLCYDMSMDKYSILTRIHNVELEKLFNFISENN